MPTLLPGDLATGGEYMVSQKFEPLARRKFQNFREYSLLYPEFHHVFIGDNGEGFIASPRPPKAPPAPLLRVFEPLPAVRPAPPSHTKPRARLQAKETFERRS